MADLAYTRWARGDCPCCGGSLHESRRGEPCVTIGEGVQLCGHCAEDLHHTVPPVAGLALLEAIAARDDGAINRAAMMHLAEKRQRRMN